MVLISKNMGILPDNDEKCPMVKKYVQIVPLFQEPESYSRKWIEVEIQLKSTFRKANPTVSATPIFDNSKV